MEIKTLEERLEDLEQQPDTRKNTEQIAELEMLIARLGCGR